MGAEKTPYQEGAESSRRQLFPALPDGYRRGRAEHTAFVDIGLVVCESCGAVVGDTELHDQWHENLGLISRRAQRADVMTRPIGGPGEMFRPVSDGEFERQMREADDGR